MEVSDFTNTSGFLRGGRFLLKNSGVNIESCTFTSNIAGAALNMYSSTVNINRSTFTHNSAKSGCIYALYSELHVHSSQFLSNTAIYGGALTIRRTQIYINHNNHSCDDTHMVQFINNSAEYGGAMNIIDNSVAFIHCARFANNSARGNDSRGGAILARTNTKVSLVDTEFYGNTAKRGGTLFAQFTTFSTSGYLDIQHSTGQSFSIYLTNCTAYFGGNLSFTNNHQSLLHSHYSDITFSGNSLFTNNVSPEKTEAITFLRSEIKIGGVFIAQGNRGENGGAMRLIESALYVHGQCHFLDNVASENGGAIQAYESFLLLFGVANFLNNSAHVVPSSWTSQPFNIFLGGLILQKIVQSKVVPYI